MLTTAMVGHRILLGRVIGLALLASAVVACSSGDDSASGADRSSGQSACTEPTGRLTMGVGSETRGLDPVVSSGSGVSGGTEMTALFDTLMQWDDESGQYEPRLAESLEPNEDFTLWTLRLRPGVTFGNGDPLTTQAVQASVERHQDPANNSSSQVFAVQVARMAIIDDLTMEFTLTEGWSDFPYILADEPGMIVNPRVLAEVGPEAFAANPLGAGAGPYEPVRFAPGEEVVLRAKDDYWGGPVCIEELRFVFVSGAESTHEAFLNGELDVAYIDDLKVSRQVADGVGSHEVLVSSGDMLAINQDVAAPGPPTGDVRLRRAVMYALDPGTIDQRANDGLGLPTSSVVHADSLYAGDATGVEPDPQRAADLVAEVKADTGWDGSIRLLCNDTETEKAIAIEAMLEAAGFDVTVEQGLSRAEVIQRVTYEPSYDLACWSMQVFEAAPWIKFNRYLRTDNPANRTGYTDHDMDWALDQLRVAATVADKAEAIGQIQDIWNDTVPSVVFGASAPTVLWSDQVDGLRFNHEAMIYFDEARLQG